ncbi:MAG: KH domain-containing protein [Bacillota bacterium]
MKQLVEILAKALVDNPDRVNVNMIEKDKSCVIELRVAPEDMGKVIGKQGRIARALRAVVKAAATRQKKKVIVEIM